MFLYTMNSAKFFRACFLKNTSGGYFHTGSIMSTVFDWLNTSYQSEILDSFFYSIPFIFSCFFSCFWRFAGNIHCVKSVQIRSFFWSVFSCIRTEYGDLLRKPPYSVRIQDNTDQKKVHIWTLFTQWYDWESRLLLLFKSITYNVPSI